MLPYKCLKDSSVLIHEKKIAINASNLHNGGGVQVATSFIYELSKLDFQDLNIYLYVYINVC